MNNTSVTAEVRNKQLECLARNIYYEAGNQPFEGKVAVAQVTINRSESGQFPKDICQVVYQKNIVYEKVLCQFSWYCESATMTRPRNTAMFKESEMVARQVLLEGFRLPSLQKALYFHATHINPKWNREKVAQIGGHIFYK
jgi:spore germination cell wall hydrolase CwlJ-like protein